MLILTMLELNLRPSISILRNLFLRWRSIDQMIELKNFMRRRKILRKLLVLNFHLRNLLNFMLFKIRMGSRDRHPLLLKLLRKKWKLRPTILRVVLIFILKIQVELDLWIRKQISMNLLEMGRRIGLAYKAEMLIGFMIRSKTIMILPKASLVKLLPSQDKKLNLMIQRILNFRLLIFLLKLRQRRILLCWEILTATSDSLKKMRVKKNTIMMRKRRKKRGLGE